MSSLFGVRPLERIFRKILKRYEIPFIAEYPIKSRNHTRYRLDVAIFCKNGKIDIECDQQKYHSGRKQTYDSKRDAYLKRRGWSILRFSDADILSEPMKTVSQVNQMTNSLGGIC
jgi:very-short-patch-repair endonuclease